MEIILSGERVDAEHAYRIGLVNRIYPQAELLQKTLDYAAMLATRAPLSHRFAKEVVRRSMGMHMDEALKWESRSFRDVAFTADLEEGVASFKERRDAKFKGN
jgi:enoyl-CoA hydratase/carnithine racemase